jgi:hypothetical protein
VLRAVVCLAVGSLWCSRVLRLSAAIDIRQHGSEQAPCEYMQVCALLALLGYSVYLVLPTATVPCVRGALDVWYRYSVHVRGGVPLACKIELSRVKSAAMVWCVSLRRVVSYAVSTVAEW